MTHLNPRLKIGIVALFAFGLIGFYGWQKVMSATKSSSFACPAPASVSATILSANQVKIDWQHPGGVQPDNYAILFKKFNLDGTLPSGQFAGDPNLPASTITFTETSSLFEPGRTFQAQVLYECSQGVTMSYVNFTMPYSCDAVRNPDIDESETTNTSILASWNHPLAGPSGIQAYILRYYLSGSSTLEGTIDLGNTSSIGAWITDLEPNTTYDVEICSECTDGSLHCVSAGSETTLTNDAYECSVFDIDLRISGTFNNTVCEDTEITLLVDESNSSGPFEYEWSTGADESRIDVIPENNTTYSVTVTINGNCSRTDDITIYTDPAPQITVAAAETLLCEGNSTQLTASTSGGIGCGDTQWQVRGPNDLLWSDITGEDETQYDLPSDLLPGVYEYRAIYECNTSRCHSPASNIVAITIASEAEDPLAFTFTNTDESCTQTNGAIQLTVTGGNAPYTYAWSNQATTKNISGLSAGDYFVTVTDLSGCSLSGQTTLLDEANLVVEVTDPVEICQGESVLVEVQPVTGVGPFTYLWDSGVTTASTIIEPGSSVNFGVTVTDANNCVTSGEYVAITVNTPPIADAGTDQIICRGDNVILGGSTVAPTGAAYTWSSGDTGTISGSDDGKITVTPTVNTDYILEVNDPNGCTSFDTVSIAVSDRLEVSLDITQGNCQNLTASVAALVTGGIPPYTYAWSNAETTDTISGLNTGTYDLTVTDNGGCTVTTTAEVTEGTPISVNFTDVDETYEGFEDGSAIAQVTGGTPPYTYRWSNGETNSENEDLPAGIYYVTVLDDQECRKVDSVEIVTTYPSDTLIFEQGTINGIGNTWSTVSLENTYSDMVVIATVETANNQLPVVSRVRNTQNNSFQVSVIVPGGEPSATASGFTIHYFVIEAGTYIKAVHGVDLVADKFNSTTISKEGSWSSEALTLTESFAQPVVLGQVISGYSDWTVFWSSTTADRTQTPTGTDIGIGRHIGEDDVTTTRQDETIAYVVLEAGAGTLNDIGFEAGVSGPSAAGIDAGASLIGLSNGLGGAEVAVLSAAGMKNDDGGWPVLYGSEAVNANRLRVAFEEDKIQDTERSCGAESVAYLVFQGDDSDIVACADFQIGVEVAQPNCDNEGLGSVEAFVDGGVSPYTYEWSDSALDTNIINDLSPGQYGLTITDGAGCVADLDFTVEDNGIQFSTADNDICDLVDHVVAVPLAQNEVLFVIEGISQAGFDSLVQNTGVEEINISVDYPTPNGIYTESLNLYQAGSNTDIASWALLAYDALYDTSMYVSVDQSLANGQCPVACQNVGVLTVEAVQDTVELDEEENPIIELVGYACGESYTPATVSTANPLVTYDSTVSNIFYVNDFPILLESENVTGSNGVFSGTGYIPLPFNKQVVKVEFTNVSVNDMHQIYAGTVDAIPDELFSYDDFGIDDVLEIDLDICQPPQPPPGYDAEGFDEVTGLDDYGFDAQGIHSETGTEYDENGFDAEGNHEETGEPYNPDGCNRDGLDEAGNPCSLIPEEVESFIDSVGADLSTDVDPLFTQIEQNYQDSLNHYDQQCDGFRARMDSLIAPAVLNFDREFIYGPNDEYYDRGLHLKFTKTPQPFLLNDARDPDVELLETTHISLYQCDIKDYQYDALVTAVQDFDNAAEKDALLEWLDEQMKKLKKSQVEEFEEAPAAYTEWLTEQIRLYLETSEEEVGWVEPATPEVHPYQRPEREFNDYGLTASAGSDEFLLEDKKEAILRELDFQFQQGAREINGVHRAYFLEELAGLQQEAFVSGDTTKKNLLPIKVSKHIGGYKYTIYLDNISFDATNSATVLDAFLILEDAQNTGKTLVFEVIGAEFEPNGMSQASNLQLVSDIELRLSNTAKLIVNGVGQTYAEWDCTGFVGMQLDAEIEFCRNYIIPLDPSTLDTLPDPERYRLDFTTYITGWLDINVGLNAPPFAVRGLEDMKWQMDSMFIDMSDTISPIFTPPVGYHSPHLLDDGTLSPLWRGFYMKQLSVTLPNSFKADDTQPLTVGAQDVVIDGCGFSGGVFAENLLDYSEGSAGGWPFSVDRFGLKVLHNHLAGADFEGQINVPIFSDTLDYEAMMYPGNLYKFAVMPGDTMVADLFLAKVLLNENSKIDILHDSEGFLAVADLSGEMSFDLTGNSDLEVQLPSARFHNFRVSNKAPYFDPGIWEVQDLGVGIKMAGFQADIFNLVPYKGDTDEEAGLGFSVAVSLADEIGLTAQGSFGIMGELQVVNNRQNWSFKKVEVREFFIDQDIKNVVHVKGGLRFFDEHPTYGKGFQGVLSANFHDLGLLVEASGQFGQFGTTNYFFVDAMADTKLNIPVGPVSISGFGGGVSYHMTNNFDATSVNFGGAGAVSTFPDIGESLSGVQYTVDGTAGLGLKAVALLESNPKENLFNGSVALQFLFNDQSVGGGLREISLLGNGHFMQAPDLSIGPFPGTSLEGGPDRSAPLRAFIDLTYNFNQREFTGDLDVFLKAGNVLRGAGTNNSLCKAQIYFGPDDWYINIGTPSNRCGILVDIPFVGLIKSTSYLNVGTTIPDFPGLPANLTSLASKVRSNEGLRKSGGGFMFGASLDVDLNMNFGPVNGYLNAGLGFDIMLRDYGDAMCNGQPVGIGGWYAAGQMWAYVEGGVKLFGIPVMEAGLAAVLQARLPNPFWAQATVAAKVRVLFVTKRFNIPIEIGQRCDIEDESGPIGMEIVAFSNPEDGAAENLTDVQPEVYFNVPIGKTFELPDNNGNIAKYEARVVSVNAYGDGGIYEIPLSTTFFNDKQAMRITPNNLFSANDSIIVKVKIEVLENGAFFAEEDYEFYFLTTDGFNFIPETNVAYSYPVNGMYEFFKEEYRNHEGFVQLVSGQPELFYDLESGTSIQMKLGQPDGTATYSNVTYNNGLITFPLSPGQLQGGQAYHLELVEKQEDGSERSLFSSLYFRVSPYAKLNDKLAAINSKPSILETRVFTTRGGEPLGVTISGIDPFDQVSITGTDRIDPLITFEADLYNDYFRNEIKPLIYDRFPNNGSVCGVLDYRDAVNTLPDPEDAAGIEGQVAAVRLGADEFTAGIPDFSDFRQNILYNVHNNARAHYNHLHQQIGACVERAMAENDTAPGGQGGFFGFQGQTGNDESSLLGYEVNEFYKSEFPELPNGTYTIKVRYRLPNGQPTTSSGKITLTKTGVSQ